jgi:putative molybdopterin biosynthesis protein
VAGLLKIAKNTVYELVKRRELNHYNVGRKMRFTKADVEAYINKSKTNPAPQTETKSEKNTGYHGAENFVISGQDALLDVLTVRLGNRKDVERPPLRAYIGSYLGLTSLYHSEVNASTAHLWDGDSDSYNVPFVRRLLPGIPAVIIHLVSRIQGFYVAPGNPKNISKWEDLYRTDIVLANREKGAGSRVLLDERLRLLKINGRMIKGYENENPSHISVAGKVGRGEADVGIGDLKASSQVEGVDFIPLQKECYDLVVKKENFEQPIVRAIMEILHSKEFRGEIRNMRGYDISGMGDIVAET